MHSIQVPTDNDLQQYPHVFFTSPDIWDPSVLDHGITPALLEEIHKEADDSTDSMFDEFGDLHQQLVQHMDFSGIQALQRLGSILFMPISTRLTLLRLIGNQSHRSSSSLLVTLPGLCLCTPEYHSITCSQWQNSHSSSYWTSS